MTHQQRIHEERESENLRRELSMRESRGNAVAGHGCWTAGLAAVDNGGRCVYIQLTSKEQIDRLIAQLQECREAVVS